MALARRGLGALKTALPMLQLSHAELGELATGDTVEVPAPPPALATRTDGLRLVHGESDGIPGVVVDRFGDTVVAQSYVRGADALARFAAIAIARELALANVIMIPAHRRRRGTDDQPVRVLRGVHPDIGRFTEDGIEFAVDLAGGQKSGAYLDLRGLLEQIEKRIVARTLVASGGVQAEAARRLGISRSDLSYKLRRLGLRDEPRSNS